MKTFFDALYQDGEGKLVTGVYRDQPFMGAISLVRGGDGDELIVFVDLEDPIMIAGRPRTALVLDGAELALGAGPVAKNLHVYF